MGFCSFVLVFLSLNLLGGEFMAKQPSSRRLHRCSRRRTNKVKGKKVCCLILTHFLVHNHIMPVFLNQEAMQVNEGGGTVELFSKSRDNEGESSFGAKPMVHKYNG